MNEDQNKAIDDKKDFVPSLPKQMFSKNIYSIVESVFPEHKYLHNQRTTYVERYVEIITQS